MITVLFLAILANTLTLSAQEWKIETTKHSGNIYAANQETTAGGINFTWDFEGGSLENAIFLGKTPDDILEFNVISRRDPANPADPHLAPSSRWYFFCLEGVSGKVIRLNIRNSECRRPFFSIDGKNFERLSVEEAPLGRGYILLDCKERYSTDKIYVAYHNPYLASRLNQKLEEWESLPFVEVKSIGKSYEGREMPMMTIKEGNPKYRVYIHGRIHPSESPASWHLEKFIDQLCAPTAYAKRLREDIEFYILPFTNPDGVENGLSRSGMQGINFEVNHNDPDSLTTPEVKNIRRFLTNLTSDGKAVDLFLNMHSQIADYVTYWLHRRESISKESFFNVMKIANLTADRNRLFTKSEFSFSNIHPKYIEGWFWKNFGANTTATTFETPYSFYGRQKRECSDTIWVSEKYMEELAEHSIHAVGDFFEIETAERIFIPVEAGRGMAASNDSEYIYLSKGFAKAKRAGAKAIYRVRNLNAGTYDLYIWKCGELASMEENVNKFEYAGTVRQGKSGRFKYKFKAEKEGDMLSSALLVPCVK